MIGSKLKFKNTLIKRLNNIYDACLTIYNGYKQQDGKFFRKIIK